MQNFNILGDALCDFCILIMQNLSAITGISYGAINILLFVVLGPLSTLLFLTACLFGEIRQNKFASYIKWTLFVLGIIIVLTMIMPIIYATLTLKG